MRKVITYGTFDLFHQGHYNILKRAKEYGDYLIVGVTSESYDIERGKLSVKDSLTTRIQNVMNTGFVDEVIIEEYLGQKIRDIIKYDIDVIVIGNDWKGKFDHLKQYCEVVYLERTKNISSTKLRENSIFKFGVVSDNENDKQLLDEVKYVSGLHIESIYSDNENVRESLYENCQINKKFSEFDEFLDSVDIVLIASNLEKRYDDIKKSILKKKHVISNYPFALETKQQDELYALAKENNVILIENVVTIYLRAFMQILWMAKGDTLGKILNVRSVLSLENFESDKEQIEVLVLGLIILIKLLGNHFDDMHICTSQSGHYTHISLEKDNAIGTLDITRNLEMKNELTITGEKGTIVVEDDWWNTGYFEFKNINEKFNKKYSYNFEGNGFRYVLQELLIMLSDNRIEGTRLFRDESEAVINILNQIKKKSKVSKMILCKETDLNEVLSFIGKRYGECLYLYLDILKYGFTDENIKLWCQKKNNEIVLLVFQYYTGMHIFTKDQSLVDLDELVSLVKERNPSMICGMETTIQMIREHMNGYELEVGYVGTIKELKNTAISDCRLASRDDLENVARFLSTDDALGKPYGFDLLYKQLLERFDQNYGRTFIMEKDGQIIATASTYAEASKCAVVSGVLVHEDYRGKGLSRIILSALCQNLLENDFDIFSYYYIEQAIRMHKSVGFEDIGQWAKLVRE